VEEYLKLLKEHKIKVTPQRLEILRYLDENEGHPTAESIYCDLKSHNPSLSKTTVYNTLEILKENGLVHVLTISETELRYDRIIRQHHHFMCRKCGSIINIEIECPHFNKIMKGGNKVEEVHGYFKGVCENCENE